MGKKIKEIKMTFFISGQESKQDDLLAPVVLKELWENNFSDITKRAPIQVSKLDSKKAKNTTELITKSFIVSLEDYDRDADYYFGYIGVFRDTVLPSVWNKLQKKDSNIALEMDDEILEKSYFIYYATSDLLVFHQNHLGPTADDLAYALSEKIEEKISFDPIWKNADLKSLLEKDSLLKNGSITLALPRKFDSSNFNLTNAWSENIIKMMSDSGMSKMTVNFWGRAGTRKNQKGYISDTVKEGMNELLSKFHMGSERKNEPKITKAEAQLTSHGKRESLLNQDLSTRQSITVIRGYPDKNEIKKALIMGKISKNNDLKMYIRQ